MIPLIAVAHGSRDPRSARAVAAALAAVRDRHPELDVRLAFLDLNSPSVPQVLDTVAAAGHRQAVVVPLLLGSAFHARIDLPALLAESAIRNPYLDIVTSEILGDDELLVSAARDNIVAAGVSRDDPAVGVALCAVGSRRAGANSSTAMVTPRVLAGTEWSSGRTCFATATEPSVETALTELSRAGARTLVLVPWMLAPGLLWDRACAAAESLRGVHIAATLTDHAAIGDVIVARYLAAVAASRMLVAA
ncbi:sirohydrochlorin chelatase [Rhodococcus sp. HNM0563]|uniref:sirohydrochlorin chelatase n=1 Tax=unclassified Rhodococcus (in: high G+C Gram-positive bacteria) TaxID=192944 RepID=UPI00146A4391|nr:MULTISPECIES: sirohydrochlorin chelatase [unclassified Rhodococcus (in: high G+C Gram-positive bacteria)]MCK0090900.1 sirohydrochlorin chelatase [Rhodococcus sp. F64268]NLU61058.1 sirohydrochlorin chelatase [Rhodococcus sp. HNM0563]